MMVSCPHRQLFGRIFEGLSSSIPVFLFGCAGRYLNVGEAGGVISQDFNGTQFFLIEKVPVSCG